jgi:hypothetical protein
MSNTVVVEIEKTTEKKLILATLTGFVPMGIRNIPKLEEKLAAVTDTQRKDFLSVMDPAEMREIYRGPHRANFVHNSNAALRRLDEKTKTTRRPSFGKTSGLFLDFDEQHVPKAPPRHKK